MVPNRSDGIIYAALVLSALAALVSAHADTGAMAEKLQWLLMQDGVAEMNMMASAIGDRTTFPVSP